MNNSHFTLPITIAFFFLAQGMGFGQSQFEEPAKIIRAKHANDPPKNNQTESLKLFAKGVLLEREDCLLEALQVFEKAAQLDPAAIAVQKKLVSLYVVLDRGMDAIKSCEKILSINKKDIKIWHLYSKRLHLQGDKKAALTALKKGLELLTEETQPDVGQQMYYELGILQEETLKPLQAANSFIECGKLLKQAMKDSQLGELQKRELQIRLVEIYERSGKLFLKEKKYENSIEAFRQAQKVDSFGASRWHLHLAEVHQAQGSYEEALKALDAYLLFQPSGTEAYHQKITILKKLGKSQEIMPWLIQASEKDRFNVGLKMLVANQYVENNLPSKAEKIYLELVKEHPKAEIYQKLFEVYKKAPFLGLGKAIDLLNKKIEQIDGKELSASNLAKSEVNAILSALRQDAKLAKELLHTAFPMLENESKLHYKTVQVLAVLADQNSQLKEAEAFYRQCLKKATPLNEAVIYGGLLRVLWKGKKYQEMVDYCKQGLKSAEATNQLLFHQELARAYSRLNQTENALKEAQKAVQLSSESSRLAMHELYVELMIRAKKYVEAETECKKLLTVYKQPGEIVEIRFLLSHLYSEMDKFAKAENELQLILKIDSNNARACNDLGYFWADRGKNLKEAEKLIRKALELDREQRQTITNPSVDPQKDNAAYVDSLGWVLFRLGKYQEAREQLERATKLGDGDDPVIWEHLGDVYFKLKMTPEAHESWQKAISLFEEFQVRPLDNRYKDLKEKVNLLKEKKPK